MNEVYARHVGDRPPARSTVEVAEAAVRRARRDRGDRASRLADSCTAELGAPCVQRHRSPTTCTRSGSTPTSSAAPCATSCSGAARESSTSSSPASATRSCAPRSSRTGKVEDLVVADQRVGVRLLPRDTRGCGRCSRRGSSSRRRGVERSTGPGRHDFEIVADAGISLEEDMERRDFTINAIARRLETGELLDPLGGRDDLERGVLRTTARRASATIRCGSCAGCGFVSQLDFEPDEDTLRQMREVGAADRARLGRADRRRARGGRDGGALEAAARRAARRRRCGSRATRACSCTCCRSSTPAIGYEQRERPPAPAARRARLRRRAGGRRRGRAARGAARGAPARPRQAGGGARRAATTPQLGARSRQARRCAGCATRRGCGSTSSGIVARARVPLRGDADAARGRAPLPRTARRAARAATCSRTSAADLARRSSVPGEERDAARPVPRRWSSRSATSPHRLARPRRRRRRPDRGSASRGAAARRARSQTLLAEVVEEPERNSREQLLAERAGSSRMIRWDAAGPVRGRLLDPRGRRQRGRRTRRSTSAG